MAKRATAKPPMAPIRHLVLVLGDQLDRDSAAFDDYDANRDVVWMAEVRHEATHVWSHKARIALFFAAMRHFCDALRGCGWFIDYRSLDDPDNQHSFAGELRRAIERYVPEKLIIVEPGEYRVREEIQQTADQAGIPLEIRVDRHFLTTIEQFAQHARGRKQLRMEFFYREVRKQHQVLMEDGEPIGGRWNFDTENRGSFDRSGPGKLPSPRAFRPDAQTKEVLALVGREFADHPGSLEHFDWPVTPRQAEQALEDFIKHRLAMFGEFQDAMWTDEPFLYHARLASSLNLKLLNPRRVLSAAEQAYHQGEAPLNAVEGFIRQVLGWREYIRGIYWLTMPDYLERNELQAQETLPDFYWTGDTDMNCLRQAIGQTLKYGYAHHIQRLMVTGLFSLLLGINPKQIHAWYLAVYVDAVEWVELPNVTGMSQFADGGLLASKPYAASGKYIQRMSNYCAGCCYDPGQRTGAAACPFTTLYWDFLIRHAERLRSNQRMSMQLKNLARLDADEQAAIRAQAKALKMRLRNGHG